MGRKHCGKRRNCSLRAISPFRTVFSKDLYCRHVTGLVWKRVNPLRDMPILGSSNSKATKDMMSKKMDKWGYNYLIE